jgi:hypothetical protein
MLRNAATVAYGSNPRDAQVRLQGKQIFMIPFCAPLTYKMPRNLQNLNASRVHKETIAPSGCFRTKTGRKYEATTTPSLVEIDGSSAREDRRRLKLRDFGFDDHDPRRMSVTQTRSIVRTSALQTNATHPTWVQQPGESEGAYHPTDPTLSRTHPNSAAAACSAPKTGPSGPSPNDETHLQKRHRTYRGSHRDWVVGARL